jgi:hypothetical protein
VYGVAAGLQQKVIVCCHRMLPPSPPLLRTLPGIASRDRLPPPPSPSSSPSSLYAQQLDQRVIVSNRLRVSGRPRISYIQEPVSFVSRRRAMRRRSPRRRRDSAAAASDSAAGRRHGSVQLHSHSTGDVRRKSRPPALAHPDDDRELDPGMMGATPLSLTAAVKVMAFAGKLSSKIKRNILHVRGVGQGEQDASGVGPYESEDSLRAVFSVFGPVDAITIRHRMQGGENTSWALVTMGTNDSAASVLDAPQVKIGKYRLAINAFSRSVAKASTGAMAHLGATHGNMTYFQRQEAASNSRLLVKKGRELLMHGREIQLSQSSSLPPLSGLGPPETPVSPPDYEKEDLENQRLRMISLWSQAYKIFRNALSMDGASMQARAGAQQAQRLLEQETQRQKTLQRIKLFRKCYGSDWKDMISMEQGDVIDAELRKMFDMVDEDKSGHLDVDEVETLMCAASVSLLCCR